MAKFVDDTGLTYYHGKLKTIFLQGVQVNSTDLTPDANGKVNITISESTNNGKIKVNNVDVDIHGLGTAAYTASTAYDASGAAAAVLGTSGDAASANTVYGAKAAAAAAQSDADALELLVGSTSVSSQISTAIGDLDSSQTATSGYALTSITETNGKLTAKSEIKIPTNNSELTNGAGYQTASDVTSAINSAIAGITGIDFQIVASYSDLPATGTKGVIYLVPNSGASPNSYDEYIWVVPTGQSGRYEKIGSTAVSLTGYWQHNDSTSNDYLVAMGTADIDSAIAAA